MSIYAVWNHVGVGGWLLLEVSATASCLVPRPVVRVALFDMSKQVMVSFCSEVAMFAAELDFRFIYFRQVLVEGVAKCF